MNTNEQQSRINNVLYFIHSDINQELSGNKLAEVARYSEQHFHRLFHSIVGESVNKYIRRIRLEAAANHLMFSPNAPIIDVISKCGFQSASSFSQAFKKQFLSSPGQWRQNSGTHIKSPYLSDSEIADAYQRVYLNRLPEVELTHLDRRHVAYVRHLGYSRNIKKTWQILHAWAVAQGFQNSSEFGIHHSNPTQTPLEECRYVACIELTEPIAQKGIVNTLFIPGGLHAKFDFRGKYGELLPSISRILEHWLPDSGLVAKTTPAFVHYHKNHFLSADESYSLSFYLPVSFY